MPRMSNAERERRRKAAERALMRRLTDVELYDAFEYISREYHAETAVVYFSSLLNHNSKGDKYDLRVVKNLRETLRDARVVNLSVDVPYVRTAADEARGERIVQDIAEYNYRTGEDALMFARKLLAVCDAGLPLGLLWDGAVEPDTNWDEGNLDGLAILDAPGEATAVVQVEGSWIPVIEWSAHV